MKCPWCGGNRAGQYAEGTNPVWKQWYCDWRKGCGMMWEFRDDGSGFYQQLETADKQLSNNVYFDGCLLIFGEEEI